MSTEDIIKKRLKKLKEAYPEIDENQLERELIPLTGSDVDIKTVKKKKHVSE